MDVQVPLLCDEAHGQDIDVEDDLLPCLSQEQAQQSLMSLIPVIEENDQRVEMDVVNLSSYRLTDQQIQVLRLGL